MFLSLTLNCLLLFNSQINGKLAEQAEELGEGGLEKGSRAVWVGSAATGVGHHSTWDNPISDKSLWV